MSRSSAAGEQGSGPLTPVSDLRVARRVEAYGVVGTPVPQLQQVTELAAIVCGCPVTVSLATARGRVAVAASDSTAVDAPSDDRASAGAPASATAPLTTPDGLVVGRLVAHAGAAGLDASRRRALALLAARAVDVLELRTRTRELAKASSERDAMRDELRRSHEQLAAFARQVSHDLRTPLTGISMCVELLGDQPSVAGDREARWMVERAAGSTRRMTALIQDLSAYARVNAELTRSDVDLDDIVRGVLADLELAGDGSSEIRVGPLPVLRGDRPQLESLVRRLLGAAARSARPGVPLLLDVSATRTTHRWRVEIADNGVAPADGDGASLTACSHIVAAHGGDLGVDDSPAGGTLVWFELPTW